jgi:hypothetical protein
MLQLIDGAQISLIFDRLMSRAGVLSETRSSAPERGMVGPARRDH